MMRKDLACNFKVDGERRVRREVNDQVAMGNSATVIMSLDAHSRIWSLSCIPLIEEFSELQENECVLLITKDSINRYSISEAIENNLDKLRDIYKKEVSKWEERR